MDFLTEGPVHIIKVKQAGITDECVSGEPLNAWMHACIAQCVFNTSMHDAMHAFGRQLIEIISEGTDAARIMYIDAMGGVSFCLPPVVL